MNGQPHSETYDFLKNTVVCSDCLEAMRYVPDESVHLTFTSPPYYNARAYSAYSSYQAYLDFLESVFRETHRITKEGRFLVVNSSPVIEPRTSRSVSSKRLAIPFDLHSVLARIGWEFVEDIVWAKPEASSVNRNGPFRNHKLPLGWKPNSVTEYVFAYRKSTDKLLDWNMRSYSEEIAGKSRIPDGFDTCNLWSIPARRNSVHPAVFPHSLCEKVISYYSFSGDLVFDPFGGSGTVASAANKLGRLFFLTELDGGYFEYMKRSLNVGCLRNFGESNARFLTLRQFAESSESFVTAFL
jgi:DNA modification methylase